jgi:O-antigen/teichoic acid export membrane protein
MNLILVPLYTLAGAALALGLPALGFAVAAVAVLIERAARQA